MGLREFDPETRTLYLSPAEYGQIRQLELQEHGLDEWKERLKSLYGPGEVHLEVEPAEPAL